MQMRRSSLHKTTAIQREGPIPVIFFSRPVHRESPSAAGWPLQVNKFTGAAIDDFFDKHYAGPEGVIGRYCYRPAEVSSGSANATTFSETTISASVEAVSRKPLLALFMPLPTVSDWPRFRIIFDQLKQKIFHEPLPTRRAPSGPSYDRGTFDWTACREMFAPQIPYDFDLTTSSRFTTAGDVAKVSIFVPTHVDERLRRALALSFENEPLEDGIEHHAEKVLSELLRDNPGEGTAWIENVLLDTTVTPSIVAGIIRCCERLSPNVSGSWILSIARTALKSPSIEIREAGIRALETIRGASALAVLKAHQEPVKWMQRYIAQVILDLTN